MSILKTLFVFTLLSSSVAFGSRTAFSKDEIVFPVGKIEVGKFLNLLQLPENKNGVGIATGPVSYREIPEEGSAVFSIGSSSYMLYWDDFNNDDKKEFLVINLFSGSINSSSVQGAYSLNGTKLISLNFDQVVIKNLFPGKDMSRFHLYLATPFAVRINEHIFLRFLEPKNAIYSYKWDRQKFSKIDL